MMFVCSIGTAAVYGLREDLEMSGYQYSWTGSIMYIAFLVWIFPTLYLLQRLPTAKYLAVNITLWGIVELCHAACTNPAGLLVCRFFLGMFQCCDLPAMIIIASKSFSFSLSFFFYLTLPPLTVDGQLLVFYLPQANIVSAMWWKKSEQPLRNSIIVSVTSSIGNGLISYGFGHLTHSALPKWKYIFLALGGFTVLYGVIMFFVLPDSIADAKWLSQREKVVAVERLRDEKLGIENKHWKWEQAKEAVLDKKNWILWLFFIAVNIPNGGLISVSSPTNLHI